MAVHVVLPRETAEWLKALVQKPIYDDETVEEKKHREAVLFAVAPLYVAPRAVFKDPVAVNDEDLPPWDKPL